jgi:hypothetical protein
LSNAQIDVNFGAGTFAFITTGSMVDNLVDANPLTFVNDAGYDLVGNGNISNATLAGNVDAVHDLSGTVSGKFFGPNAQELGGTFDLAGPDGRYTGSFGAVD